MDRGNKVLPDGLKEFGIEKRDADSVFLSGLRS